MPTKTISFTDEQWESIEKTARIEGFSSGNEAVRAWSYQKALEIYNAKCLKTNLESGYTHWIEPPETQFKEGK